ncbi:MAG TPA: hypothetical protein VG433_09150 [Pirellulales bacterium]|nr:hypothetical protein [Pirellulales bacterium]
MSVASRKVGSQVHCPKCLEPIVVPAKSATQSEAGDRHSARPPELKGALRPGGDGPADVGSHWASERVEYEDVAAVIGSAPVSPPAGEKAQPLTQTSGKHHVPVSRRVLYLQAVIILVVSLGALWAGYHLGLGEPARRAIGQPAAAIKVAGQVTYTSDAGQPLPDAQAVILAFPLGVAPADKIPVAGLRPDDVAASQPSDGLRALEASEGIFRRANDQGAFELELPPGEYAILAISKHAQRPGGAPPNAEDMQLLAGYFQSATELLGPYRYEYCERRLPEDAPLKFSWGK